jgi:hypothetical protein
VSTNAPEPSPAPESAYDREVLRRQIEILRREAASRARLEIEIHDEHDQTVSGVRAKAEAELASTAAKHVAEIDATRREYDAILAKASAYLAAERKKLDDQRGAMVTKLGRDCDNLLHQAKEEDQFEEGSFLEVFKEKRKDPLRLFAKGEKDLARAVAQIGDSTTKVNAFLAERRVPAVAADASGAEPEAASGDVLATLETLRSSVEAKAAEILGLAAAKTAFGGGIKAAVIALPLVLALVAAAAAFFLVPGDSGLKAGAAAAAAAVIAGGGIGAGFFGMGRMRSRARGQLSDMASELGVTAARALSLQQPCVAFLAARRDQQAAKLEERFKQESEQRAAQAEAKRSALVAKKTKALGDLEAKFRAACDTVEAKVADARTAAEKKYPPKLAALEASQREQCDRIARDRDAAVAAANSRRDERHAAMTAAWKAARESTVPFTTRQTALIPRRFVRGMISPVKTSSSPPTPRRGCDSGRSASRSSGSPAACRAIPRSTPSGRSPGRSRRFSRGLSNHRSSSRPRATKRRQPRR